MRMHRPPFDPSKPHVVRHRIHWGDRVLEPGDRVDFALITPLRRARQLYEMRKIVQADEMPELAGPPPARKTRKQKASKKKRPPAAAGRSRRRPRRSRRVEESPAASG